MNPVTLAIAALLLIVSPQSGATSPGQESAIHSPESAEVRSLQPTPAWTFSANQTNALVRGVATAGDVNGDGYSDVLVSSALFDNGQTDEGKVWLFLGSASGLSATPNWTAEGEQAGAYFGVSVATAGDVNGDGFDDVIIGASTYDAGQTDEGRAFLYLGSASGLSATPDWTAEGNQAGALFAYSVATAGDVNGDGYDDVIIGAQHYHSGQTDEGAAHVYLGNSSGLASTPVWTGEPNVVGANYGVSVASAGDVNGDGLDDIIVGAPGQGRAYVYLGNATGVDANANWWSIGDPGMNSFGQSVSGAGDVDGDGYAEIIVGAPTYSGSVAETNEGKVYVYPGSATGVSGTTSWTYEGNLADANLGYSVSVAGDTGGDGFADVIVGASGYENGQAAEGRAYLFRGYFDGLSVVANWTAESDQASARLGYTVACAGDVDGDGLGDVLIAAPYYDDGEVNEGRAYLYRGITRGPTEFSGWTRACDQDGARFGRSVAWAGDVNGDGFTDVLFGAPSYDNAQPNAGMVELFHSSLGLFGTTPAWTGEGDQSSANFGLSVAGAGDVNGDGYDDIVIGAPGAANPLLGEGRVYVYYGSATGVGDTPAWTYSGGQTGGAFGWSVASAGDVNGDGFADVIVGAYNYDSGQTNEGRAFLFLGSASGLGSIPAWTADGNQDQAYFGYSVASAGDVNGDGYGDVIVGAPGFTNGQTGEGRAYLFRGSADGLTAASVWGTEANQAEAEFGKSVAGAGDVNGDGYGDLIIGAPRFDYTQVDGGRASVYLGSSSGPASGPSWTLFADQAGAQLGFSVAGAGDVNDDGFSDIVTGAVYYAHGLVDEGAAVMYLGTATGLTAGWTTYGGATGANFGSSVAGQGDAAGDGFSDLLVGAQGSVAGAATGGRVNHYSGNGSQGLDRAPVQRRADDTANIGLLGRSESSNSFRLGVRGRTPAGRGMVRMVWEVKPRGVAFDGSGVVVEDPIDTGIPGALHGSYAPLDALCDGLNAGTSYRWRLRVLTDSPFFPGSPWLTHPGNAVTETDLRTAAASSAVDEDPAGLSVTPALRVSPNPARSGADLAFSLRADGPVRIDVFDAHGRRVASLVNERRKAGPQSVAWDGRDDQGRLQESGVYFVRCVTPEGVRSAPIVVSR